MPNPTGSALEHTSRPTPADLAAHAAASHVRPMAPLSADAAKAMAKLERAFLPLALIRAVARYEAASARRDELTEKPASQWTAAEFDSFMAVHNAIVESVLTLGEAGRLDLIAPAEAATRYRYASKHCREFAESADFEGCLAAQDEMQMCLCQLEQAGRLDLIEVAS